MLLLESVGLDFFKISLVGWMEGWAVESCPLDGEGSEKNADIRMKITRFRRIIYKQKIANEILVSVPFLNTPKAYTHREPNKTTISYYVPRGLNFPSLASKLAQFSFLQR